MKLLERIKARYAESAWAPLAAKTGFGAIALKPSGMPMLTSVVTAKAT